MHAKLLLKKYGISPKKAWSQYFLTSFAVIEKMASYARGTVLEIGPGLGFITAALAQRADRVIAIEKDKRFQKVIQTEYAFDNVEIIIGDITTMNLPPFDRVISNIPYHLSSQIMFQLLEYSFECGILSFQKEFAQRLVEESSPDVSRLSIMTQVKADCEILQHVSRKSFYPVPRTDCALVKIHPHTKFVTDDFFDTVVKGLFSHKRKTVKNALRSSRDLISLTKEQKIPHAEKRVWSLTLLEIRDIANALRDKAFLCSGENTYQ